MPNVIQRKSGGSKWDEEADERREEFRRVRSAILQDAALLKPLVATMAQDLPNMEARIRNAASMNDLWNESDKIQAFRKKVGPPSEGGCAVS